MIRRYAVPVLTVAVVVSLLAVFFWPSGINITANEGLLSLNIADSIVFAEELPEHPNQVVDYPGDLSGENWDGEIGLELSSNPIPSNVHVLGAPLLEGTQTATMDMDRGCFSWYMPDSEVPLYDCFPRLKMGNETSYLNSVVKIPKYDKVLEKTGLSYNGTNISWLDIAVDYSYGIVASETRDDYRFQLSVTTPVDTLPFSYQYVILFYEPVTTVRFYEYVDTGHEVPSRLPATLVDVDITKNGKADLPLDLYPIMTFLDSSGDPVTSYNFHDLMDTAIGLDWRAGRTVVDGSNQMAFILSFDYPALPAGGTFHNDGYFGYEGADNTLWDDYSAYLMCSQFQNDVASGTVTKLEINYGTSGGGSVKLGLYTDDSGDPDDLLDMGETSQDAGWVDAAISAPISLNDYVWIGFQDTSGDWGSKYFTSGSLSYQSHTYADAWPDPFGTHSDDAYEFGLRAYVEEAAGGPEITSSESGITFSNVLYHSQTYWTDNTTLGYSPSWPLSSGQCYAYLENTGDATGVVTANATNFLGGTTLSLTDAAPGSNTVRMSVFKAGDGSTDNVTLSNDARTFLASMASGNVTYFEVKLEWNTSYEIDAVQKTSTITFTISAI